MISVLFDIGNENSFISDLIQSVQEYSELDLADLFGDIIELGNMYYY